MERRFSTHPGKREGRPQTDTKTVVAADRVSRSDNCVAGDGGYKVFHRGNDYATIEGSKNTTTVAESIASSGLVLAGRDGV